MKTYRISSKPRFIAFVAISIILFTLIFNFMFEISTASSDTNPEFVTVHVGSGDTLWNIAEENMPGIDVREAVYIIMQANDLDSAELTPGMVLDVPVQAI